LDSLLIHPESYSLVRTLLKKEGFQSNDIGSKALTQYFKKVSAAELTKKMSTDSATISLIIDALSSSMGHDLRWDKNSGAVFRSDVLSFEDLKCGQKLTGKVANVVPFGAFVDVGVGRHGLIHRSKMGKFSVPSLGQRVEVLVAQVEKERKRIALELLDILG